MMDKPDAATLLEAVRELLSEELQPTVEDRGLRFKLLIAANLLAIVERELRGGELLLDGELARLATLLDVKAVASSTLADKEARSLELNRQLCARIRAGEADGGDWAAQTQAHLKRSLLDQLQLTNPRLLSRLGIVPV